MKVPVLILAGGLGSRLKNYSISTPKALVKVAGKPFIFWQLELLKNQGFKDIVISSGHLGHLIIESVGDGGKLGLNIQHVNDGNKLLGTGGAIKNSLKFLPDHFLIMYGDTYLPVNFKDIINHFLKNDKKNMMVILKNKNKWVPSNIVFTNNSIVAYSKGKNNSNAYHVAYGISILSKEAFLNIDQNIFDMNLVFQKLISENKLIAYEVRKRFYEIGTIETLKETESYLRTL